VRYNDLAAVRSVQGVLTPEQWQQLPEWYRNPRMQRGPGGGGGRQGGTGPERARPPGA
jgi:hypothetical protein